MNLMIQEAANKNRIKFISFNVIFFCESKVCWVSMLVARIGKVLQRIYELEKHKKSRWRYSNGSDFARMIQRMKRNAWILFLVFWESVWEYILISSLRSAIRHDADLGIQLASISVNTFLISVLPGNSGSTLNAIAVWASDFFSFALLPLNESLEHVWFKYENDFNGSPTSAAIHSKIRCCFSSFTVFSHI